MTNADPASAARLWHRPPPNAASSHAHGINFRFKSSPAAATSRLEHSPLDVVMALKGHDEVNSRLR
jgi:hypothetical protein